MTDPITLDIIQNALQATADEMFAVLRKTAMSSIIYEVLDMGTGITDAAGDIATSGAGIPSFVGVLDKAVKVITAKFPLETLAEGDIFLTNDPFHGGVTHLNDLVLMMPVFAQGELIAWTANIAHNSDVGGLAPGSLSSNATEIYQEGLRLPAIRLIKAGEPIEAVFDILMANSRMPDVLRGDVWAAIAAVRIGARRLTELAGRYGVGVFRQAMAAFMDHGERIALAGLAAPPKGRFSMTEEQDDGSHLSVTVTISVSEFVVDLTGNPDQAASPMNTSRDGAMLNAQMVFKSLTDPQGPANAGSFRPVKVLTRKGSIFDPVEPAPFGFYYETEMRLHDLICRCLAQVMPERFGAGHFGSICGTFLGGIHPDTGRPYTIIEPQIGGWGGRPGQDGISATFSLGHGETYNCPAEVNEARNGLYVEQLALNMAEGGEGQFTGGRGIVMDYRIRAEKGFLTAGYTRSKFPAWGLKGGREGSPNLVEVIRPVGTERYAFVSELPLEKGDVVRVITGNGGGYGEPFARDPVLVARDVKDGFLTAERAAEVYGRKA